MARDTRVTDAFMELACALRERKNLTIEQLAELAGVHRTTIGLLERKERSPSLQIAKQIADALDAPLAELIQEAELVASGVENAAQIAECYAKRELLNKHLRNEDVLIEMLGIDGQSLLMAIDSCYQTLDRLDKQLRGGGGIPLANLVELANLSSMIGNLVAKGIADCSDGVYIRNKPHTYPDLLPIKDPGVDLELKMALETNKPKGHLPKAGTYVTFRYVLGDKQGTFLRGRGNRGDTVWIWEVKIGKLAVDDFSCSNTPGDSGKTAVIKTAVHNKMPLVYYVPEYLPYAAQSQGKYVGYN